jgi:hypothetical protein
MSGRAEAMSLKKELEKQGFTVERTGSGHWKAYRPGRQGFVIFAFSPNHTGMHLTVKRLKKLGYRP